MSLLDEVKAEYGPRKLRGMTAEFYPDWASFWAACPLSRSMLVQHNPDGSEKLAPETHTEVYQKRFFNDDSFGLVFSRDGAPVTGVIYRRLAPDTVEQTLRVGQPAQYTGLRHYFYLLGVRKIRYSISKEYPSIQAYMERMDAECGNVTRTITEDERYKHYEVTLHDHPKPPAD